MNNRMPKILTSPTKNAREVVNPRLERRGFEAKTLFIRSSSYRYIFLKIITPVIMYRVSDIIVNNHVTLAIY